MNSKVFQIETPKKWNLTIHEGDDSYAGRIIIDSVNYLSFDYGFYSNNLEEYLKEPADSAEWTLYPPLSQLGTDRNSQSHYEIIDRKKAKVVKPLKDGVGLTGIYFDSLKFVGTNKVSFELSGFNLTPENQHLALAAFKSLKFINEQK
ncbi:MAG: hypothetical protein ABIN67_04625 [Ferruginibacter sp.]